jgi:hypothetical protein
VKVEEECKGGGSGVLKKKRMFRRQQRLEDGRALWGFNFEPMIPVDLARVENYAV